MAHENLNTNQSSEDLIHRYGKQFLHDFQTWKAKLKRFHAKLVNRT